MGMAVLVVEDEALIRFVAVDVLEEDGCEVYEAASVLEAVGKLSTHHDIGVVFTDVDMPGDLSGLDLARLVASIYPEVGILVTSGRYQIAERDLPAGARFLPKPYRIETLRSLVAGLMPLSASNDDKSDDLDSRSTPQRS